MGYPQGRIVHPKTLIVCNPKEEFRKKITVDNNNAHWPLSCYCVYVNEYVFVDIKKENNVKHFLRI